MRIATAVLLAVLAGPSTAFAQDPAPESEPPVAFVVAPRASIFFAAIRGRVRADEGTFSGPVVNGSSIRLSSDLDLDDDDPLWIAEISLFHRSEGRHVELTSLSFFEASYEGSSTLGSSEAFNGRLFSAGTGVRSDWRYRSYGLDFSIVEGLPPGYGDSTGAVIVGLRYTDFRVSMEGGGAETSERLGLFWAGAGIRGELNLDPISALFKAALYASNGRSGGWYGYRFDKWGGLLFEGSAGVAGSIGPVHVEAGWRLITAWSHASVDDGDKFEDNEYSFLLGGPYLSATLRF